MEVLPSIPCPTKEAPPFLYQPTLKNAEKGKRFAEKGNCFSLTAPCAERTIADMVAAIHPIQGGEVTKTDAYRLIVFNRAGTAVLLESRPSGYDLPLVDIPKFTRSAKEITTGLRDRWRIPSVLLFSGLLEQNPVPVYFAALEAQVRTCRSPGGMNWFPVDH